MMVAGVIVNAYHVDLPDSVIRLTPSIRIQLLETNYKRQREQRTYARICELAASLL